MGTTAPTRFKWGGFALPFALLAATVLPLDGPPPGFRPPAPEAASFIEALDHATVDVLPTVVRGVHGMEHSLASRELIVLMLRESGLMRAIASQDRVDLDAAPHESQWEIFNGSMRVLANALQERESPSEYTLVMEMVLPPGDRVVFGIETYILDWEGRNSFSFLLNSHHEIFASANLVARDGSDAAREAMILDATRVAVTALKAQIADARECAAWMAAHPAAPATAGVFQDFDEGLPGGQDTYGNPLGFSTFKGGRSTAYISPTRRHPTREGEAEGNRALRIDLDVKDWAGFTYVPHDPSTRTWLAEDWSGFQGLSFWMYGNGSGARLYVHVFDNRSACSTVDDAERFGYEFVDDFTGWKQIVIPFDEMVRAEIGNGAPDDGFGLTRVHGWAFGSTRTSGSQTWFLDDFALWKEAAR